MVPNEVLGYRHPVPRGDFVELLAIDDHVTVQRMKFLQHCGAASKQETLAKRRHERDIYIYINMCMIGTYDFALL